MAFNLGKCPPLSGGVNYDGRSHCLWGHRRTSVSGIAVAEELRRKGHQCRLLISQKQVDSALVQKYHLEFIKVPGRAFSGGLFARIRSLYALSKFPICARTFKSRSTRRSITLWFFIA